MTAPFGSWRSPLGAATVAAHGGEFLDLQVDGPDLFWLETRPAENGRHVIVRNGADLIPPPFTARSRANEYGGGAFWTHHGTVWFSHDGDRRLYRVTPGQLPRALTPPGPFAYADGIADPRRNRVICVREDHTDPAREPVNTLVAIDSETRVLATGHDFYSNPRLSADGRRLAWLTWNQPHMPWDGTDLWVAEFDATGQLGDACHVAGGAAESIFQPEWSPDGSLYFVSDRSGWWNLQRWDGAAPTPVLELAAEFGRPQWVFGMSTYALESARRLVCAVTRGGVWQLATLELPTGKLTVLPTPHSAISQVRAQAGQAWFIGGSPTTGAEIVRCDLARGAWTTVRAGGLPAIDAGYLSLPETIEFPTTGGQTAHAFFYPPRNRDCQGPAGELPPLLVKSHGGPTGAAANALDPRVQFWTSRGFAVVDVNYAGSTGFGRAYRERLRGQWGVADVDDCVNAARWLAAQGRVDGARLAIRGSSAGGYTTLAALTFRDVFRAGASYYGVSDLETLARDTHKFEARYLDWLIAPYPAHRAVYAARSPIHFVDRLRCPLIVFQGLDDKIVPPAQATRLVEALQRKGVAVEYWPFAGEGHGFRQADTLQRCLEAELAFYGRVFGFTATV